MTNTNDLYPHLQLYNEYINNGDINNATNLLSHNDELNKYIQDKKDENGYMTSNDISNYINNEISNGKLLSSNEPLLTKSPTPDTGLGGSIWKTNLHEDYDEIKEVSTCGYTSDLIRTLLPTIWTVNYDSWTLETDGALETTIHPLYDKSGMIEYLKKYYIKVNDFILTTDNILYRITNISNVLGQMDWYQIEPIYSDHLQLRAPNGNEYRLSISNEGQIITNIIQ